MHPAFAPRAIQLTHDVFSRAQTGVNHNVGGRVNQHRSGDLTTINSSLGHQAFPDAARE